MEHHRFQRGKRIGGGQSAYAVGKLPLIIRFVVAEDVGSAQIENDVIGTGEIRG